MPEPVSEHSVESLDVNRHRLLHLRSSADSSADLNTQQPPMLITVFDRLRQRDPFWYDQGWSPASTRPHRFTVGLRDRLGVGSPAVATPAHRLPSRTSMRLSDRLGCQGLRASSAGVSNDEATLAVLDHTAPALAPSGRVFRLEVALLLLTNDQNSSTSSAESSRSWTNTSVSASACSAASLSQRAIVS
jgi:hypothetical protein